MRQVGASGASGASGRSQLLNTEPVKWGKWQKSVAGSRMHTSQMEELSYACIPA